MWHRGWVRLNPAKTEVLWLGSKYQVDRIAIQYVRVLSTSVKVANTARDLGVIIDRSLIMSDHVAAVCRAAYFQLRLITRLLTAWTIAILCFAVSQTVSFDVCSLFRIELE